MNRGGPTEQELVVHGYFDRRPDGRWGNEAKRARCACAEGLAAEIQADPNATEPVDCLTCANWHPQMGCVFGANQELDGKRNARTLWNIVRDQAKNWVAVAHYARAIERLESFLRERPDDAEAFLTLARVYDHPGYHGKDKRRAAILYKRYLALSGVDGTTAPEAAEAQRRIEVLQYWEPDPAAQEEAPHLATFTCFYRFNAFTHFLYGVLTDQHLILVNVGDADPETGIRSVDLGTRFERASKLFRWISGESLSKEREVELTETEIRRVAGLSLSRLLQEREAGTLDLTQVEGVKRKDDVQRRAWVVALRTGLFNHELVLPHEQKGDAEKLEALLKAAVDRARNGASSPPAAQRAPA